MAKTSKKGKKFKIGKPYRMAKSLMYFSTPRNFGIWDDLRETKTLRWKMGFPHDPNEVYIYLGIPGLGVQKSSDGGALAGLHVFMNSKGQLGICQEVWISHEVTGKK